MIDGKAEIIFDGESKHLETGESIIVPAHTPIGLRQRTASK